MAFRLSTAAKLLHRPHLVTPQAAEYWAGRLREIDGRAFRREGRLDALARKLGLGRPRALEDDDIIVADSEPQPTRPAAYAPMWMGEPDKQLDWGWSIKDGVAMMEIAGPLVEHGGWGLCEFMHGYDTISAAIDELDADASAKGGIIRFDTPGGVVASGIYDLSAKLQARGPGAKPIWAVCEMACSAGYWIASQCDKVLAPQAGLIGSIGVVMVHENHAGALEKFGIEITSIEAPEGGFKTDGAWWKAMSEEGKAALQSDINELFNAFLATVEAGRGAKLTADKARGLGAQVFPAVHSDAARDAVAIGLIDGVMSEQAAFEAMKAEISATPIPATAGITAARAAQPKPAPVAGVSMEIEMKRAAKLAAIAGIRASAKTSDEKIDEIEKILAEPDDEAEAADDGDEPADGEGAPAAEDDKPDARTTGAKPAMVDATVAQAVLALPEAKGREALAQRLAFKPGMTVAEAKADLAAAPLGSRMAGKVVDPKISAADATDNRSEALRLAESALAAAGFAPAKS